MCAIFSSAEDRKMFEESIGQTIPLCQEKKIGFWQIVTDDIVTKILIVLIVISIFICIMCCIEACKKALKACKKALATCKEVQSVPAFAITDHPDASSTTPTTPKGTRASTKNEATICVGEPCQ